jgi:HlyD family secretion protein
MMRRFILIVLLLAAATAGLSYAYSRQDKSFVELSGQATREAHRHFIALRDATRHWHVPKRELEELFVDGRSRAYAKARPLLENAKREMDEFANDISRAYARVRPLFEKDSYTYVTAPIERGRIATVVRATGTVKPTYTVDISSQLSGRMAEVLVSFNDVVRVGQPLGRLDREIYAAKVGEARAELRIAHAGVQMQQAALERARGAQAMAQMARNVVEANRIGFKAKFDESQRELDRRLILIRTNDISKADLSRMQAQRDEQAANAQAMAEEAKIKQEAITMAEAEIHMAEANLENTQAIVEQKQAALDQAEFDLSRTELRAPIGGIIIKRDVNPGQTVAVSLEAKTLFQIANDLREMEVHGRIDEADIGRVKPGQTVTFTVDAFPGRSFAGQVQQVRIAPEVVQNVVTYTVVITAPNPEKLLLPGMTASLRILIDESPDILKVPNQALRFRPKGEKVVSENSSDGSATVWVLRNNDQPFPVRVTTGRSDDKTTELQSDELKEHQPVIVGIATSNAGAGPLGIRLGY